MTGFAAAGKSETTDFADRIGRKVIVQHEIGVAQTVEPVDHLLGILGAQGRGHDCLGFTAGKQSRTMGPWQQANHRLDRANLIELAAIDTGAILDDRPANDFGFQLLDHLAGGHLGLAVRVGIFFFGLVANRIQRVATLRLVGFLVGCSDIFSDQLAQFFLDRAIVVASIKLPGLFRSLLRQIDDQAGNLLGRFVSELHGAKHDFLGQFLRFRFNHHHRAMGSGNHQVELAIGDLFH